MNLSYQIAEFVANTRFSDLDEKTVTQTRYALLDGIGVSLAATTLGEGCKAFQNFAISNNALGHSAIWGTGKTTSPSLAAFANGALAHALDFEDTHDAALVHPNAAVIPAVIAVAQSLPDVDGKKMLTAIAVGCEVVCRLGLSLTEPMDQFGWYPPPILSAYGATAAVASLYQFTPEQVVDAFSMTLMQATCSGEIKYNPDSVVRAVRDAFPAQIGVVAAELARNGVKGFAEPLEGKAGFFASFTRGNFNPEKLVNGLGKNFTISELSFKAWPSCRGTHVFIDMLSNYMTTTDTSADEIESVTAIGNRINRMLAEPLISKQEPVTSIDAKFSIPYCLGWTATKGLPGLHSFFQESLSDSAVLSFAEKVNYQIDETLGNTGAGMLQGRLIVQKTDGTTAELSGKSAPGAVTRPLGESALIKKFSECCRYYSRKLSDSEINQLVNSLLTLDQCTNLSERLFKYL